MYSVATTLLLALLIGCSSTSHRAVEHLQQPALEIVRSIRAADSAVLYSLLPITHQNIPLYYPDKATARRVLSLPSLHEYPIYGTMPLTKQPDWARWSGLLSTSFEPRPRTFCDFEPRHAVRILSGTSTQDILMCFQCGDMFIFRDGHRVRLEPVWSTKVEDEMNKLLDRNGIRRDSSDDSAKRLKDSVRGTSSVKETKE